MATERYIKQEKVTEPKEVTLHVPRATEHGPKNSPVIVSKSLYVPLVLYNDIHQLQTVFYNKRSN